MADLKKRTAFLLGFIRGRTRLICRFVLILSFAIAPILHAGAPASSGTAGAAPDLSALDEYVQSQLEIWRLPGLAIAIVKDGQVVLAKGYGVRNVEQGGAVDENTLFAIASNSKAFNAAALAILVDEGKLEWGDRVAAHLPYFQLYDSYVTQEMRIRDLLCHRAGLGTFSGDLIWWGTGYASADVVRRAKYLQPAFPFRAGYGYSNIMFIAAGEIVPAVTNESWPDFVRARIFQPLAMDSTVLSVNELAGRANVAAPHREIADQPVPIAWQNWDNVAAAGGIISSVNDMAKWLRLQLGQGEIDGKRLFSEESAREMWSPQTIIPLGKESEELFPSTHFRAYGLGWVLSDYLGKKIIYHSGGYDGMFSRVVLAPEENLGIVLLTNGMTSLQTGLAYRVLDMYLGADEQDWSQIFLELDQKGKQKDESAKTQMKSQRVAGTRPSLKLESYAGTYGGAMYGEANISLEDGKLVMRFLPNPQLVGELSHWHYDTFIIKWRQDFAWFDEGTVQFLLDKEGKASELRVDVPNHDLWFTELEFKLKRDRN